MKIYSLTINEAGRILATYTDTDGAHIAETHPPINNLFGIDLRARIRERLIEKAQENARRIDPQDFLT